MGAVKKDSYHYWLQFSRKDLAKKILSLQVGRNKYLNNKKKLEQEIKFLQLSLEFLRKENEIDIETLVAALKRAQKEVEDGSRDTGVDEDVQGGILCADGNECKGIECSDCKVPCEEFVKRTSEHKKRGA